MQSRINVLDNIGYLVVDLRRYVDNMFRRGDIQVEDGYDFIFNKIYLH